jgi:hypothetical protein
VEKPYSRDLRVCRKNAALGTGAICEARAWQPAAIPTKAGIHSPTFGNVQSPDWIRFRGNDWRIELLIVSRCDQREPLTCLYVMITAPG